MRWIGRFAVAAFALAIAVPVMAQRAAVPAPLTAVSVLKPVGVVKTASRVKPTTGVKPATAGKPAPGVQLATVFAQASVTKPAVGTTAKAVVKMAVARPKRPVEALLDRGSNPKGPFATLTMPQRDSIINQARDLLGVKYKWAGLDPVTGLDCSGIVKYVFAKLGIDLPHHAADLAKLGGGVTKDTAAMRPGDLLVFGKGARISHVGIYIGDGMMIHASSSSHRVVEAPVETYRRTIGLQWKGVRRVIALAAPAPGE